MAPDPHDALFKTIFERPEHARAELQSILPRPLAQALDWSTLTLVPGEFRDATMARYHTDLLFSVRVRDGGEAFVYLLFEHQSAPDHYMAFRLLRYMARIWESWLNQHEHGRRLPLIVPVVFYHGARPWSAPLHFESLITVPSGLDDVAQAYIPSFRYLLDDLSRVSDDELRSRALPVLALIAAVCLRDLRKKHLVEAFWPWVNEWIDALRAPHGSNDLRYVIRYVYKVKDAAEVQAFEWFLERELGSEAREIMVSYAEQLIQEGVDRGIQQGMEQGMEQGIEQGEVAGERKLLLRLLRERFGSVDTEIERRIATATTEQLESWGTRILSAVTLAEVLAD